MTQPTFRQGMQILMLCLLAVTLPVQADDEAKLEALKAEIAQLKQALDNTSKEFDRLSQSVKNTDKEISDLTRQVDKTRRLLQEEQARLKKLQQDRTRLDELQARYRAQLANQIRAAYRLQDNSSIKVLLSQQDAQLAQRMMTWFGYFNRTRSEQIGETLAELDQLNNIEKHIREQQQALQATRQRLERQNRQLAQKRQQQETLLAQLAQQKQSEATRLKEKVQDRLRLEQLVKEVRTLVETSERQIDSRPIRSLKGKLQPPVKGPIRAAFGNKIKNGMGEWHGWLIGAPSGSDVKAIHHGRVVFSDWMKGFGMLMLIDHGDNYLTLYAHNQALFYDVGAWVNQGDLIASVGRSGGQSQSGLYFEIRYKGQPQDPAAWLSR
ncbi:MAG: murein hydrolase activator EnvC family protein [Oceanobacter sp.]